MSTNRPEDRNTTNRFALLKNLSAVMRFVEGETDDAEAGQVSLFGNSEVELKLDATRDPTLEEMLAMEIRALGGPVSAHPTQLIDERHFERVSFTCRAMNSSHLIGLQREERLVIIAWIETFNVSRNGRVAFMKVSDLTGAAELIAFSDEMERYRFALEQDAICAIKLAPPTERGSFRVEQVALLGRFNRSLPKIPD